MKYEEGDEVIIIYTDKEESPLVWLGVLPGFTGEIVNVFKEETLEYNYGVDVYNREGELLYTNIGVYEDEMSLRKCGHSNIVWSKNREKWLCPFCEL